MILLLQFMLCLTPPRPVVPAVVDDAPDPRPDVLVLLADDLGWHDVGFTGGKLGLTPEIDALAAGSTVFTEAYSDGPNCAPSRASLLTGLSTPRHRIITVLSSRRGKAENRRLEPVPNVRALDDAIVTLPERLRDAGWRTAHLGKFHVGADPREHGFTDSIAGDLRGHPRSYHAPYRNDALEDGPDGEYLTDRLADEAIAIIGDTADDRPLFMHLAFFTVHTPIQARSDLLETMQARHPERSGVAHRYGAMLMALDEAVGRVLAALEARGRPTLVVFASDNGGLARIADNGPVRGSKGMLYEGGIRIPLAVRWPGERGPETSPLPVLLRDLAPTILELGGIDPADLDLDGRSFASIASGDEPEAAPLHWHFPAYLEGGGAAGPWRTTPVGAVRDGPWKLIQFFEDDRVELYNLDEDPAERNDRSVTDPGTAERLRGGLEAWRERVGARMPTMLPSAEADEETDSPKEGT